MKKHIVYLSAICLLVFAMIIRCNRSPEIDTTQIDKLKAEIQGYESKIEGLKADTPDVFDDKFYLFHGEKFIMVTTGTTNPGLSVLKGGWKSLNKDGAFILMSDYWHYNIWMNGKHNGKMKALVQYGAKVVGYRDNNNNGKSEEIGKQHSGWYGINFHLNSYSVLRGVVGWFIGGWSAGCQVCNNATDYYKIINLVKDQKTVSYCLLNEF